MDGLEKKGIRVKMKSLLKLSVTDHDLTLELVYCNI